MSLKYYADENAKYRALRDTKLTDEEALKAYAKLFRHFGVPPIRIEFKNKGRNAHYNPFYKRIRLIRSWMNWKTLAHEFAHYLDDVKRNDEIAKLKSQLRPWSANMSDADKEYNRWNATKRAKIENAHWHGRRHEKLMARVIAYIEKKGWNTGSLKPMKTIVVEPVLHQVLGITTPSPVQPPAGPWNPFAADDARAAFYESLDESFTCPKCHIEKHKAEFGVRVMKKDADGKPLKISRQSYCRQCRSSN